MTVATQFTLPDAVEAWDAEFRWRQSDRLCDVTIDDTWRRVADAAAAIEHAQAPLWAHRYIDGFSRWRLLPEERLLRCLGTDQSVPALREPGAVLNVAAFVNRVSLTGPAFDRERFVATASLAVRFLDDAAAAVGIDPRPRRLRIGLIGLADALQALDLEYGLAPSREQAAVVVRALAEGCLRGSVELAEERGRRVSVEACQARVEGMRRRGMPDWLVERVVRIGLCHDGLTAIDPHPNLARLANGVADAISPLPSFAACDGRSHPGDAELAMRAQLQPWIDEPPSYPLPPPCADTASPARAAAPSVVDAGRDVTHRADR